MGNAGENQKQIQPGEAFFAQSASQAASTPAIWSDPIPDLILRLPMWFIVTLVGIQRRSILGVSILVEVHHPFPVRPGQG
jgi:hypothetical protein